MTLGYVPQVSAAGFDWRGVGELAGSRTLQQNGFETRSTHL